MTLRTGSCGGCGATLEFASAATVLVVCPHCGGASWRSDRDLAYVGKVAEVAPIASPLSLGETGRFEGVGWTCVGQLQLDHGRGPWNEWCLLFDDGSWRWYAEAQGEALLTRPAGPDVVAAAPERTALEPGTAVDLPGTKDLLVAEVGVGRVTAARGELPARVLPGSEVRYADLRGPAGAIGTLDYGAGDACQAVYLGRTVAPEELGLAPEKAPPVERRVESRRLACPSCAASVELRDPESVRVACGSCGTLIDPGKGWPKALGPAVAQAGKVRIPLGTWGTLRGARAQTIAFLARSVTVEGVRYPWREYLLRTERGAYRWLVESKGHWALLDPVNPGDVSSTGSGPVYRGVPFRHFATGSAVVDHVLGEVYWEVEVGETVRSEDFVAPPLQMTIERSGKEVNVTAGEYVPREEVEAAFSVKLPEPSGVAPAQPNPWKGQRGAWWGVGAALVAAAAVLMALVAKSKGAERVGWFFPGLFLFGGLLIPPLVVTTRHANFEVSRWADSDHPIGEA